MVMISPVSTTTNPAPARQPHLLDRDAEMLRTSEQGGVIGKGILGFGDADRQAAETEGMEPLQLPGCGGEQLHPVPAVDVPDHGFDLFPQRERVLVKQAEGGGLFRQRQHFIGELEAAFAALCPHLGERHPDTERRASLPHQAEFRLGIGRETVDGDHGGQPNGP